MECSGDSIMAGNTSTFRCDRSPVSSTSAKATVYATTSWSLETPDGRSVPSAMASGDSAGATSAGQTGIITATVWTSWLDGA